MIHLNTVPDEAQIQEKMEAFQVLCKDAGLKLTPQRLVIYRALLENPDHPCAEALHRQLHPEHPSISLDTVSRTLQTLSEIRAAYLVEGTGEPKRFDANLDSHQHFRCVKCKRIIDFHHEPFDNMPTPQTLDHGFQVLRKTVYFEGICDHCQIPERYDSSASLGGK